MANEPLTAEQKEALATQIVIAGTTYQLKGLTAAQAADLYSKLPAEYQTLAKQYAAFAKNYRASIDIKLPTGMKFEDAWKEYLEAAHDGAGKLVDQSKPYLQEFATLFDPLLPKAGFTTRMVGKGIGTVGELLSGAVDGVDAGLTLPFKLLSASTGAFQDGWRALATGINDEKAQAFGAALAGSVYYEAQNRLSKTPGELSMGNPMSAITAGWQFLTNDVPVASDAWVEIKSFCLYVWELITHIGKDEPARTLEDIRKENYAKHAADQGKSYTERLQAELAKHEFPKANARVKLAGEIAGESVQGRSDALEGGAFVGANGQVATVDQKGTETAVKKADGKPLTLPQVTLDRFNGAFAEQKQAWDNLNPAGKVAMGAVGVATAGALAVGTAKGAAAMAQGAVAGYREAPLNRANAEFDRMQSRLDKAEKPAGRFTVGAEKYAEKAANAMHAELDTHEARGGKADAIGKTKPGLWSRIKYNVNPLHWPELAGRGVGRVADEVVTTATSAKDVFMKSGGRLSAAAKFLPRTGMLLNVAGATLEDGVSMGSHVGAGDFKGATVDGSKIVGTVAGSAAGTMAGVWSGGNIGMVIGGGIGTIFGGIGAIPGAAAGRVAGSVIGGFMGGWGGGVGAHDATGAAMASALDYKPKPEQKPEVKAFSNEELAAMHEEVIKAARSACKTAGADGQVKFNNGQRVGFASCKAVSIGAAK